MANGRAEGSPRRPEKAPRGSKWWAKGPKWWAKGSKEVPNGSQKTTKRKRKTTYERKREHIKNIEKTLGKRRFFMDLRGLDPSRSSPETIKNQSLEAKRPKVRGKSGPSAKTINKKLKKRENRSAWGPKKLRVVRGKVRRRVHRTSVGGSPPPYKYLSKLR